MERNNAGAGFWFLVEWVTGILCTVSPSSYVFCEGKKGGNSVTAQRAKSQ
jgi:hypothetical protein